MLLVPSHETAEVVQPRKQSFDLPAAAIATQLATILGDVASG